MVSLTLLLLRAFVLFVLRSCLFEVQAKRLPSPSPLLLGLFPILNFYLIVIDHNWDGSEIRRRLGK